jgi:hypothetical protein
MVNGVLDYMHRPDDAYFNKEGDTAGAGESRSNSRCASTVDQPIDAINDEVFDEDFGMMSEGDVSACSSSEESERMRRSLMGSYWTFTSKCRSYN